MLRVIKFILISEHARRYLYLFWRIIVVVVQKASSLRTRRLSCGIPSAAALCSSALPPDNQCLSSRGASTAGKLHQVNYSPFSGHRTATDHYTAIQWLVHWSLMGGLLHLVGLQRGEAWAGCGHAQSPPHCTECNSPPIQLHIIRCGTTLICKGLTRRLKEFDKMWQVTVANTFARWQHIFTVISIMFCCSFFLIHCRPAVLVTLVN